MIGTLRADGYVLQPVDTAGLVLELLLILEQYWTQHHLTYPIFFLTYVSSSTIDYVKSFLEWMSDSIAKSFEHTRDNAFLLKQEAFILFLNVTLLINKMELEKFPEGPKIVLASMASLEAGFSHDIFMEWAPDAKNLVLFTERSQISAYIFHHDCNMYPQSYIHFGTLARMLQADPPPKAVKATMSKRVPLVGDELAAYEEEQNRIKNEEALKASLIKEEESKHRMDPRNMLHVPVWYDGIHREIFFDGFIPPSSSVAPMFPFYENSSEWDDFGEVINPDDYVINGEDMDQGSMQVGGDLNGKFDEGSTSLILDTAPSKVVSNELTVLVHGLAEATGRFHAVSCKQRRAGFFYAAIILKFLPPSDNALISAVQNDRSAISRRPVVSGTHTKVGEKMGIFLFEVLVTPGDVKLNKLLIPVEAALKCFPPPNSSRLSGNLQEEDTDFRPSKL
ncbi:hypothetical protein RHGRI_008569 [Rhododendron griersonianum]|uniref:Cleavage and polyadenylation specificity factor subunit 2 n=1 Tax=Rhododendron griersonianum TaxID=479676 RepID=A0AAV6L2G4_9ERIC|nr:hypothetical protein RHGRI_008569 [Rhododendron griersonianum]